MEFMDKTMDRPSTVDSRRFGGTCSLAIRADVSKLPRLGESRADSGTSAQACALSAAIPDVCAGERARN